MNRAVFVTILNLICIAEIPAAGTHSMENKSMPAKDSMLIIEAAEDLSEDHFEKQGKYFICKVNQPDGEDIINIKSLSIKEVKEFFKNPCLYQVISDGTILPNFHHERPNDAIMEIIGYSFYYQDNEHEWIEGTFSLSYNPITHKKEMHLKAYKGDEFLLDSNKQLILPKESFKMVQCDVTTTEITKKSLVLHRDEFQAFGTR